MHLRTAMIIALRPAAALSCRARPGARRRVRRSRPLRGQVEAPRPAITSTSAPSSMSGTPRPLGGAMSARGVYEYEFNLRLAKQIAQKLIAAGFERTVLLITAEAPRAGLFKRVARANAMGADLFLSDPPRLGARSACWRNGSMRASSTATTTGSRATRSSSLTTIPRRGRSLDSRSCSANSSSRAG